MASLGISQLASHLAHEEEAQGEELEQAQRGVAQVEPVDAEHAEVDGEAQRRFKVVRLVGIGVEAGDVLGVIGGGGGLG